MVRPVVVYVEEYYDWFGDHPNTDRDALEYLLRHDCGCDVLAYQNIREFKADIGRIKKLIKDKRAVLFIAKQEEYVNDHRTFRRIVRNVSARVPIVILSKIWGRKRPRGSFKRRTFVFWLSDDDLVNFVKRLTAKCKSLPNWYGAESFEDQANLQHNLQPAYTQNYLADTAEETLLGAADTNGQVVAEALRLRLLPAELVKKEFDDVIRICVSHYEFSPNGVYDLETDRIRKMDSRQRERVLVTT